LEALLRLVSSVGKSSLFVGGPGTAKTTVIKSFMESFDPEEMASKVGRCRFTVSKTMLNLPKVSALKPTM
jgi:MoxR-like ATPase